MLQRPVYVIGTFDTKAAELFFASQQVLETGCAVRTVDVSTTASTASCDVSPAMVAQHHPGGEDLVLRQQNRGDAVDAMGEALVHFLCAQTDIGAVLGLGGSGNTSIVTKAMRALPIGIPKFMVSTLASGNVAPFVGASDIIMMHAVADIAGLNEITRAVIGNAAHAAAGMAMNPVLKSQHAKPALGMTMFGVTTSAVDKIRKSVEDEFECFVFHATGIGGQCFEKLIDSGFISAAVDLTTTEIADYLFGGILPCTPDRFGSVIRKQIPYVGSVGALDMINFGARSTVPPQFEGRQFHVHNSAVTLMRTTVDENAKMGGWIIERINQMQGAVRFLLPLRGISTLDCKGQVFSNPEADDALFSTIRKNWNNAANRKLIEVDCHINDDAFAEECVAALHDITH